MTPPAQVDALRAGAAAVAIGVVRTYQWTLRPVIGSHCRFWPSCSEYAVEALRMHGAARGTALAARRILRCNPWHEGGIDLVPRVDPTMGDCQTAVSRNGRCLDGRCLDGRCLNGRCLDGLRLDGRCRERLCQQRLCQEGLGQDGLCRKGL